MGLQVPLLTARALDPAAAASGKAVQAATITSSAMTMQGAILGTAAYMAPEQANGRHVDKRADIWASGAVLSEMLTGRRDVVFRSGSRIMAAGYAVTNDSFVPNRPRVSIDGLDTRPGRSPEWDPAPDGTRVAVLMPVGTRAEPSQEHQIVFMLHFADEVRRRAPVK